MPSLAQHLPEVVLRRIFDYLARRDLQAHDARRAYIPGNTKWLALRVCRTWRQMAIRFVYNSVSIYTTRDSTIQLILALGISGMVKEVTFMLHTDTILDGSALSQFSSPPMDSCVLKLAASLRIYLTGNLPTTSENIELFKANAYKIFSEVQRMVPSATRAQAIHSWAKEGRELPSYAANLLRLLYAGKSYVNTVDTGPESIHYLFSDDVHVQNIDAWNNPSSSQFLEIVRRNAPALQTLRIMLEKPAAAIELITDEGGSSITYPRMHSLELSSPPRVYNSDTLPLESPGGAPFPALQRLTVDMPYPFANGVLLHGSEQSLRVLNMRMDIRTLDTLSWSGVLDRGRFRALDIVKLDGQKNDEAWVTKDYLLQLFEAFSSAPVLSFCGRFEMLFGNIQPYLGELAPTLRVLDIRNMTCTLGQLITLIASLPFLQTLNATCLMNAILEGKSDRMHNVCIGLRGLCSADRNIDARHAYYNLQFVKSHVGIACQTMSEAGVLLASRPPISQRLLHSHVALESICRPIHHIRLMAILMILCPSIRSFGQEFGTQGEYALRSTFTSEPAYMELLDRVRQNASGRKNN